MPNIPFILVFILLPLCGIFFALCSQDNEKTKGRKVFMRFDSVKYDAANQLLCYLYLDNKTFLNAHLLKNGLADVDFSYDFKYKNKFESLASAQ